MSQAYSCMENFNISLLTKIATNYTINQITLSEHNYIIYQLIPKKRKDSVYLFLSNNYNCLVDEKELIKQISVMDSDQKNGNIYLCVLPKDNASKNMCTSFNGKSFLHYVFWDRAKRLLIYDEDFHYWGSKHAKKIINICQEIQSKQS